MSFFGVIIKFRLQSCGILVYKETGEVPHNIIILLILYQVNVTADNKPIKKLCNGFHKIIFYGHFITTNPFKILRLRDI